MTVKKEVQEIGVSCRGTRGVPHILKIPPRVGARGFLKLLYE
jgi:hypothetical protein